MTSARQMAADVEQLWRDMRRLAVDRVRLIRAATTAARDGRLDERTRSAARSAAHQLAGSLGSYRRPAGSRAAAIADRALADNPVDLAALAAAVAELDRVLAGELR